MYNDITRSDERGVNELAMYEHRRFKYDGQIAKLVQKAAFYYDDMEPTRKRWKKATDYFMGRQLEGTILYNGQQVKMKDYMRMKGLTPAVNDVISDKIMTMIGLHREANMTATVRAINGDEDDYVSIFAELLRQNDNVNDSKELYAQKFGEHVIRAFTCLKSMWTWKDGVEDIFIEEPDVFDLAIPAFRKRDLSDVEFIAEGHDMTDGELLQTFARTPKDSEELRNIYKNLSHYSREQYRTAPGENSSEVQGDFLHCKTIGRHRVLEIWTKERQYALWCHDRLDGSCGMRPLKDKADIEAENQSRNDANMMVDEMGNPMFDENGEQLYYVDPDELQLIEYEEKIEDFWYYRFVTPNGYLLKEGKSPIRVIRDGYAWYVHPYDFLAYPCLDGETRSLVERQQDKQDSLNHYMIMFDFIMANSAKGVLYLDRQSLDDEYDAARVSYEYNKPDGLILYDSKKGGNQPMTLNNQANLAGIQFITNFAKQLSQEQSGVQGALQGIHRNTSGKQYQLEKNSAATNVSDYLESFDAFKIRVARKRIWLMQVYYDESRSVKIAGRDYMDYYNPETMGDMRVDMAMDTDPASASVREQVNDLAWQLYNAGQLDLPGMLASGSFANSAKLKAEWERYQEEKKQLEAQAQQGSQAAQVEQMAQMKQAPGSAHLQPQAQN